MIAELRGCRLDCPPRRTDRKLRTGGRGVCGPGAGDGRVPAVLHRSRIAAGVGPRRDNRWRRRSCSTGGEPDRAETHPGYQPDSGPSLRRRRDDPGTARRSHRRHPTDSQRDRTEQVFAIPSKSPSESPGSSPSLWKRSSNTRIMSRDSRPSAELPRIAAWSWSPSTVKVMHLRLISGPRSAVGRVGCLASRMPVFLKSSVGKGQCTRADAWPVHRDRAQQRGRRSAYMMSV